MKPRPELFAVPVETTVERFIEMLRAKHYSRVPVYAESIHNIKGIVYAQDVLQVPDSEGFQAHTRDLMPARRVFRARKQTRQRSSARNAEKQHPHGDRGGRVWWSGWPGHDSKNLVEEIVGEIRDEHEKPGDLTGK